MKKGKRSRARAAAVAVRVGLAESDFEWLLGKSAELADVVVRLGEAAQVLEQRIMALEQSEFRRRAASGYGREQAPAKNSYDGSVKSRAGYFRNYRAEKKAKKGQTDAHPH